jgi:tetratricopeptide (TPR) repeat protein
MKVASRILGVAVLAMLFTVGSWAQLTKGFRGKVLDRQGKPAVGATVKIVDESNPSNVHEVKTDKNGMYIQAGLTYSDKGYKISVQLPGLPEVSKIHKVRLMEITDVDFDMRKDVVAKKVEASPAAEAKNLYEMGDYEGALAKANEALAKEDNVRAALFFKAACLNKMGDTDNAIQAFESFNAKYPGNTSVLGMLAELYQTKGNKEKAEYYKKAFAAKGGKIKGESYNDGVKALNSGDAKTAAGYFEKAAKEDPNDADSHREWARSLAQLGEYQKAIDQLKIYLKLKPNASDAATWKQAIAGLEQVLNQQNGKSKK